MEELYKEGKIRTNGVSNFYSDPRVDLIIHNEITLVVNQVETHPFCQQIESAGIMKEKDELNDKNYNRKKYYGSHARRGKARH
jgi:2,5-diketo-D-gluconate reductase A